MIVRNILTLLVIQLFNHIGHKKPWTWNKKMFLNDIEFLICCFRQNNLLEMGGIIHKNVIKILK